ncbi:MAG: methylenetetrahydrofolate reductase [Paracoccaceae bacterium]
MARLIEFLTRPDHAPRPALASLLDGYSIEMVPATVAKTTDLAAHLPARTRVYLAHIAGTPIEDMTVAAASLARQGFEVMPHFPARAVPDTRALEDWIARYQGEAGVTSALVIGGGLDRPTGAFDNAMELLASGAFDRAGFTRLHVAGHPEGNRDIDPQGGERAVMDALRWKRAFNERTDAKMAIVTQFCFEPEPVIAWGERLREAGIDLPVHIGTAGPAKLQTLIRFAATCGVGASMRVLKKRAADVTKLLLPYAPDAFLGPLAQHKARHPGFAIERVHFFPFGGVAQTAAWARSQTAIR